MADQPQNPNYIYGTFTTQMSGMTAVQKHQFKANTLSSFIDKNLPFTFVRRTITVTVTQVKVLGEQLILTVNAAKTGNWIFVNNPLVFINPPLLAPNGQTYTDATGVHPVMAENPLEALKEIVTQAIERQI